jgi:hypothetical protein
MRVRSYQLRLLPDPSAPPIRRLCCSPIDVDLADVFRCGIHPHSATTALGQDSWHAVDVIVDRLNATDARFADLERHQVGHAVTKPLSGSHWGNPNRVLLDALVRETEAGVSFADDLTYQQLRNLAIARLRHSWKHEIARDMARGLACDFATVRAFIKQVNPDVRLTGYGSLDDCDLSEVLRVDDFLTEERLLLHYGLDQHCFRRAQVLSAITDASGRLRLAPRIDHCSVTWSRERPDHESAIQYQCLVKGDRVTWRPSLTPDDGKRRQAQEIAGRFGHGSGHYCFVSTVADLGAALDDPHFTLRFPTLNYAEPAQPYDATASLRGESVRFYGVATSLHADRTNTELQSVLRTFGLKTSGTKPELVRRLAGHMAEEFTRHEPVLDAFFGPRRFIRLRTENRSRTAFPVLQEHPTGSFLLIMYCLRHMRGNVVLEARHRADTTSPTDLADAILTRRVKIEGHFVEVL